MSVARPVRVLHLIAELGGGGSERWLWDMIRLSPPEKFVHHVVTYYPEDSGNFIYAGPLRTKGALAERDKRSWRFVEERIEKIRAQRSRFQNQPWLLTTLKLGAGSLAMIRVVHAFKSFRPDVVHVHTVPDFIPGIIARILFGKPMIHTVPCLFSQLHDAGYGWMPKLYSRLHPWVDYFSSGEGRTELLAVGVPAHKIIYDLGGADLSAVDATRAERHLHAVEVRRSLGLRAGSTLLLSVGRLHRSKGHVFALEALPLLHREFENLHWLVLGEGADRAALDKRAEELGITDRVHIAGFQPNPLPYYAASDLYLRTALFEPENLSFYQAMAMGIPVVGFSTGWESDPIFKVGHGMLVPTGDSKALAAAVSRILSLPDRGREMGERGAAYSRENLDLRQSISLICSVYQELYEKTQAN